MLCKEDRQRYSKSSLLCRRKGGVRTESIYVDMIKMRKKGFAPVNRVAGEARAIVVDSAGRGKQLSC